MAHSQSNISSVVIAIITCKRKEGLNKLLSALSALQLPNFPDTTISVVVVENGEKLQAEEIVEAHRKDGLEIVYGHEPQAGISYARNAALALAAPLGEYFAFLDDDEYPDPRWLDHLLQTVVAFEAKIVRGPVLPVFPQEAPRWASEGAFYLRERFPTGTVMTYGASNNVILLSELVLTSGVRFDARFALTGGEDTLFFLQLKRAAGSSIYWCDEAVVYEDIPLDRITPAWLSRRARREGANMPQYDAVLGKRVPFYNIRWVLQGLAHVCISLLQRLGSLFRGEVACLKAIQRYHLGVGMMLGSFGYEVEEYKQRHVS
ncbi:MAG: glycosyltransferase family 2 protein [Opitutaceae bacterium]